MGGDHGGEHRIGLHTLVFPALLKIDFSVRVVLFGVYRSEDREEIRAILGENSCIDLLLPEQINWHNEIEVQQYISGFDVGLATLTDDPVQIAKSGIKVKQYMISGVPVLCNDLPENNQVLQDGANGFLCENPEEFVKQIRYFRQMPHREYTRLSENARRTACEFGHEAYWNTWNIHARESKLAGITSPEIRSFRLRSDRFPS